MTFKLPYIEQSRTKNIDGIAVKQSNKGLGDLILGLPLKHYSNIGAITDNFEFTPSVRLPTGRSSGDFPISDGSIDAGLSFSYSIENPKYYALADLFTWQNTKGHNGMRAGNEYGFDLNLGYHPYHNNEGNYGAFVMLDVSARYNETPNANNKTSASGGKR